MIKYGRMTNFGTHDDMVRIGRRYTAKMIGDERTQHKMIDDERIR